MIAAHVVAIAAIDEQRVRGGIGARADHLRGEHRRFRMRVVEIQQDAQALRLTGLAFEFPVAQLQLIQFGAQPRVFGAGAAEADVVGPDAAGCAKTARCRRVRRASPTAAAQ